MMNFELGTQALIALDLEGVLIPEIWHRLSEVTGESAFKLTTRDICNYDELMKLRIDAAQKCHLTLSKIQRIIQKDIVPFEGAVEFLRTLRMKAEVVILSDTFVQFMEPVRPLLEYPVIFCNSLAVADDVILRHIMRMKNGKQAAVKSFQTLQFTVAAAGDSYNDVAMLRAANYGVFFKPAKKVLEQHGDIPTCETYENLMNMFETFFAHQPQRCTHL